MRSPPPVLPTRRWSLRATIRASRLFMTLLESRSGASGNGEAWGRGANDGCDQVVCTGTAGAAALPAFVPVASEAGRRRAAHVGPRSAGDARPGAHRGGAVRRRDG